MSSFKSSTITYLGHATVLVESPGGTRILIDPWITGNPSAPNEYSTVEKLGKVDLVLLTHIHNDHAGDAISVLEANPNAVAVCIPEVQNWLNRDGVKHNVHEMNIGGSFQLPGTDVTISMTLALHTSSYTECDGTLTQGGQPVGFVIEMANGFCIYNSGDTGVFGDMALIRDIYHPDVAILPIGDNYTMGPRTAAIAIKLLGARMVVPVHYGTFSILTGSPNELQNLIGSNSETLLVTLRPGETAK